jgi:hypothetical protein
MGFNSEDRGRATATGEKSFASRLRALFWISMTNMVFPCEYSLLSVDMAQKFDFQQVITTMIALLIIPYLPYVLAMAVMLANVNISFVSVVFATGRQKFISYHSYKLINA